MSWLQIVAATPEPKVMGYSGLLANPNQSTETYGPNTRDSFAVNHNTNAIPYLGVSDNNGILLPEGTNWTTPFSHWGLTADVIEPAYPFQVGRMSSMGQVQRRSMTAVAPKDNWAKNIYG